MEWNKLDRSCRFKYLFLLILYIAYSGSGPGTKYAQTEIWNGTNWTEVNDLNTARSNAGGAGEDSTTALCYAGYTTTVVAVTEEWNGTNWTETTDVSSGRSSGFSSGTATAALYSGGNPGKVTTTEEWTGAGAGVTRTFTDS